MTESNATRELQVERDGHVIVLKLDRESRMNAVGRQLHAEIDEAMSQIKADKNIRAIVITATGERVFCSGMDLKEQAEHGRPTDLPSDVRDALNWSPLHHDIWLPTIVAVNGTCAGGGLHFVADADVVLASTRASFVEPHVNVGQVAAIEPLGLIHRIGLGRTLRLAVLGVAGRIEASEALRIGLVDEVLPPLDLMPRALELAHAAASGSPAAIEASKRAIHGAIRRPMEEDLEAAYELLVAHRAHPDAAEGPRAFVERRPPQWSNIEPGN